MALPLSALRRALAETMRSPKVGRALTAPMPGAMAGGAFGAAASAFDGDTSDAGDYALTGAGIGAGLGALGAGAMFRQTLREALAEQAASRGVGRRAAREAAHAGDAAAFSRASEGAMGGPQSAEEVAQQIRELSDRAPPGTTEALVSQLREQDPKLARDVMMILMRDAPY